MPQPTVVASSTTVTVPASSPSARDTYLMVLLQREDEVPSQAMISIV